MAEDLLEKYERKLKDFLKEKEKAAKRFKSVMSFVDSASDEEVARFLEVHRDQVFSVLTQRFAELEAAPKKDWRKQMGEVMPVLKLMRAFLVFLPGLIRKRWQMGNISRMIEQCLHRLNQRVLRMAGLELLMLFIEGLGSGFDEQIGLFARALRMEPFTEVGAMSGVASKSSRKTDRAREVAAEGQILCRSADQVTVSDTVELLTFFFDHITGNPQFDFWFSAFRIEYAPVLFPTYAQEAGLSRPEHSEWMVRFARQCPTELLLCLAARLEAWYESPFICTVLWKPVNALWMIEIFGQVCRLPMAYSQNISSTLSLYRQFLMARSCPYISDDALLQRYWCDIMTRALAVFDTRASTAESVAAQVKLCREVLDIFDVFSADFASRLSEDSWLHMQRLMVVVFSRTLASTPVSQPESLMDAMAGPYTSQLLMVWLRSPHTTPEMWKTDLGAVLLASSAWTSVVVAWRDCLMLCTYQLVEMWFMPQSRERHKAIMRKHQELEAAAAASLAGANAIAIASSADPRKLALSGSAGDDGGPVRASVMVRKSQALQSSGPEDVPVDPRLVALRWDRDKVLHMWRVVLTLLGNPSGVPEPGSSAVVVAGLCQSLEYLMAREKTEVLFHDLPPLDYLEDFVPWLLELSQMPDAHLKARTLALAALCQVFTRKTSNPLPTELLSHFYRVVYIGLEGASPLVAEAIANNSTGMFSNGLPGCAILIPPLVSMMERSWSVAVQIPSSFQMAMLQLLYGIQAYGRLFDVPLPELTAAQLLEKIVAVCGRVVGHPACTATARRMALGLLGTLGLGELVHGTVDLLEEIVRHLLSCAMNQDTEEARTAVESLGSFAVGCGDKFARLAPDLVLLVIDQLGENIVSIIGAGRSGKLREALCAKHLVTMRDMLLMVGSVRAAVPEAVAARSFRALECALLGEELPTSTSATRAAAGFDGTASMTLKASSIVRGSASAAMQIFLRLDAAPSHGSTRVRMEAESALFALLAAYNNFPTTAGNTVVSCPCTSEADESLLTNNELYFALRTPGLLFSVTDTRDAETGAPGARLTVRSPVGKFVWDFSALLDPRGGARGGADMPRLRAQSGAAVAKQRRMSIEDQAAAAAAAARGPVSSEPYVRAAGEPPTSASIAGRRVDALRESLDYMAELVASEPDMQRQSVLDRAPSESIAAMAADVRRQESSEGEIVAQRSEQRAPIPKELPSSPPGPFQQSRLLLAHLGFLGEDPRTHMRFVTPSGRLSRHLFEVDKYPTRDVMKVGLIYVRDRQEAQEDLLTNVGGSDAYRRFVGALAWLVDLETHAGYMGGLDNVSFSSGRVSPYWSSSTTEVMFHDPTLMPNKAQDSQQVQKKRHVGNDYVHLVFSENRRDYDPRTITSRFNDAHIVVSPLPCGLYAVRTHRKESTPPFGPLDDGMVLPLCALIPAVRVSLINANMNMRAVSRDFQPPCVYRRTQLVEITEKHSQERTFEDFMTILFHGHSELFSSTTPNIDCPLSKSSSIPKSWF